MDFFTVPTVTFRVLYVWFAIDHPRRGGLQRAPPAATRGSVCRLLQRLSPTTTTTERTMRLRSKRLAVVIPRRHVNLAPLSSPANGLAVCTTGTIGRGVGDDRTDFGERHPLRGDRGPRPLVRNRIFLKYSSDAFDEKARRARDGQATSDRWTRAAIERRGRAVECDVQAARVETRESNPGTSRRRSRAKDQ